MKHITHSGKLGFTFIEILVVMTIIGLLATVTAVSYSQFSKTARDGKRKSDLEQIRGALELYRANNSRYPNTIGTCISDTGNCTPGPSNNVYMPRVPLDPKNPAFLYYYSGSASDYSIAAQLEGISSCITAPGGSRCGTGNPCNYCLGPFGQK